jgi:hypothetical protein
MIKLVYVALSEGAGSFRLAQVVNRKGGTA